MLITRMYFDANATDPAHRPVTVGGVWESNTIQPGGYTMVGYYLNQVLVTSTNALTTYDFIIKDDKDYQIRKFTTATYTFCDLTPTPTVGALTLRIENASADEAFSILLVFIRPGE